MNGIKYILRLRKIIITVVDLDSRRIVGEVGDQSGL